MTDIEYLEARIDEQTRQLDEMKTKLATDVETKEAFDVYTSFIRAGFTPDQAWELFLTVFKAAVG